MATDLNHSADPLARLIETQHWIPARTEIKVQQAIQRPFQALGRTGRVLLSLLHGHWLHEPLHVVITDVPIGAWTVTVAADTLSALAESPAVDTAADIALVIGLLGAAGAAVTGVVDWSEIKQENPRQIGSVHAILNVAATTLFAASCILRRTTRRRTVPRALAAAGYVFVSVSAHLGGNLVYEHRIGVKTETAS